MITPKDQHRKRIAELIDMPIESASYHIMNIAEQLESSDESYTFYKGISLYNGYNRYKHNVGESGITIPGFLSTYHIARVYSEPILTGDRDDPSMIISVEIAGNEIEDRTAEFIEWADARGQEHDISLGYPKEWRSGAIWTINLQSCAHGGVSCYGNNDFVFCGVRKPYVVVRHYNNQEEWAADK